MAALSLDGDDLNEWKVVYAHAICSISFRIKLLDLIGSDLDINQNNRNEDGRIKCKCSMFNYLRVKNVSFRSHSRNIYTRIYVKR